MKRKQKKTQTPTLWQRLFLKVRKAQEMTRLRMAQQLKQLDVLQAVLDSIGIGVLLLDHNNKWHILNRQMETFAAACGGKLFFVEQANRQEKLKLKQQDQQGKERVFRLSYLSLFAEKDTLLVQETTEQEAALEYQILHDTVTGLPNRALLRKRLKDAIQVANDKQQPLALLMIDLNGFKEINNTLGHGVGDQILCQLAERLPAYMRSTDIFARLGGDEFAVILPETGLSQAQQITEQLLQAIYEPFEVQGQLLRVSASVGIVSYPEHGTDRESLFQHADIAMYVAKHQQIAYAVYNPAEDTHSLERLTLMEDLRQAIEQQSGFILHYQPQLDLQTGRIQSLEALLRWQHPKYGWLSPDKFIPVAERSGLIVPLTYLVLDMALYQCANWQKIGINVAIAVNFSVNNLQDAKLPNWLDKRLKEIGLSADSLRVEITETVVMSSPQRVKKVILELERMGIHMAIDDFGTGYSSLAYLRQLPLSEIKIDKSFVMTMCQNDNDIVIVRSIIDLAHNLGYKVVAEGVEDQQTQDTLEKMGCDIIQGYYLSKPQSADKLTAWLQARCI